MGKSTLGNGDDSTLLAVDDMRAAARRTREGGGPAKSTARVAGGCVAFAVPATRVARNAAITGPSVDVPALAGVTACVDALAASSAAIQADRLLRIAARLVRGREMIIDYSILMRRDIRAQSAMSRARRT